MPFLQQIQRQAAPEEKEGTATVALGEMAGAGETAVKRPAERFTLLAQSPLRIAPFSRTPLTVAKGAMAARAETTLSALMAATGAMAERPAAVLWRAPVQPASFIALFRKILPRQ